MERIESRFSLKAPRLFVFFTLQRVYLDVVGLWALARIQDSAIGGVGYMCGVKITWREVLSLVNTGKFSA